MKKIILLIISILLALLPFRLYAINYSNNYVELNTNSFDNILLEKRYKYYREVLLEEGFYLDFEVLDNYYIDYNDYIYSNPVENIDSNVEDYLEIEEISYTYYSYDDINYITIGNFNNNTAEIFNMYELRIFYNDIEIDYTIGDLFGIYGNDFNKLKDDDLTTSIDFLNTGSLTVVLDDNYNPRNISIKIGSNRHLYDNFTYQISTYNSNKELITHNNILEQDYPLTTLAISTLYEIKLEDNMTVSKIGIKEILTTTQSLDYDEYLFVITNKKIMYQYKIYKHYSLSKIYLDEYYSDNFNLDSIYIKDESLYTYYYLLNNDIDVDDSFNLDDNSLNNENDVSLELFEDIINSLNEQIKTLSNNNVNNLSNIEDLTKNINDLNFLIKTYDVKDDNGYLNEILNTLVLEPNVTIKNNTIYYIYAFITILTIIITIIYFKYKNK